YGMQGAFKRTASGTGSTGNPPLFVKITASDGTVYSYGTWQGFYYAPAPGSVNSLSWGGGAIFFSETQPNGTVYTYPYHFQSFNNVLISGIGLPQASNWVPKADAGGKVTSLANPLGVRTSLAYDASNKLRRVTDSGARMTSFTVDGSGNLSRIVAPD